MPFPIDIRTIFYVFSISNLLIALFLFVFIRITHSSDQVLKLYLLPKCFYFFAFLLFGWRDIIPDYISITVGNSFLLFAISLDIFCIKHASKSFLIKKLRQHLVITILLVIFFCAFSRNEYHIRVLVNSCILFLLFIQGAISLLVQRSGFTLQKVAGVIFVLIAILFVYRSINILFFHTQSSLLQPSTSKLIILYSIFLVSIFNTFLLFLISKESDNRHLLEQNKKIETDNQLLNKLNTTKNKFLSIISHDLRGPLGNIENLSFLLQDKGNNYGEHEKDKYLNVIQRSASQANRLLNNLLFWSLSESDSIRYTPAQFPINKLIEESISLLYPLAIRKHIIIHKDITENLNAFADIEMTNTIIRNLINNSIKYSHPHSSITIKCYASPNKMIKNHIIDQGVKMSPHSVLQIFKSSEFYSEKGTCNENGTGLGLKLCIEFAKQNRGELGVESTVGKGSCFWFTLPTASTSINDT